MELDDQPNHDGAGIAGSDQAQAQRKNRPYLPTNLRTGWVVNIYQRIFRPSAVLQRTPIRRGLVVKAQLLS
uniref:Uncharacterized protein n=1 Tax=Arundo donax TaxID=35708 RepID=A0A0A8XZS4_ARUDO